MNEEPGMRRSVIKDAIVLGSGTLLVLAIFLLGRFIHAAVHGACNCTPGLLLEYGPSSVMLIAVAGTTLWVLMARSKARLLAAKELKKANERMKSDLESAAKIQRSLLPSTPPDIPGVHFAWAFEPCEELAGDIFNVFPLNEQNLGLYTLDVSGHGLAAALLSVTLNRVLSPMPSQRSLLQQHIGGSRYRFVPPAEVAQQLNQQFPMDPITRQYFTLLYGILDLETREFRYVSAGHPGPVYLSRNSEMTILDSHGFPIGLFEKVIYEEHSISMNPGDRLYLYSDGITEAMNEKGQQFGKERLVKALDRSRAALLNDSLSSLLHSVEEWCGAARLEDDISILAVEVVD